MNGTASPAQAQQGAQAQANKSFRRNTRQRGAYMGSQSVKGFQTDLTFNVPDYGMASRILLFFDLTVLPGASQANAGIYGPFGLLKAIKLNTNLGTSESVNLSGYGLHIANLMAERDLDYTTPKFPGEPFFVNPANFVNGTLTVVRFCLELPVAANTGSNFGLGLVNMQAPEITATVDCTFGGPSDGFNVTDGAMVLAGTVYPYYEYYEIPPPSRGVQLPPLIASRWIEETVGFQATGQVRYTVPRMGKVLRMASWVIANGALLTGYHENPGPASGGSVVGVDSHQLKFLGTDTIYDRKAIFGKFMERRIYGGTGLPAGTHAFELWASGGDPGRGDARDWFDSTAISLTDFFTNINSGVTLGVGNNVVHIVRQIVQSYTVQGASS